MHVHSAAITGCCRLPWKSPSCVCFTVRRSKNKKGHYSVDSANAAEERDIALEYVENAYVENATAVASENKQEEVLAIDNRLAEECEGEKACTLDGVAADDTTEVKETPLA